VTGHQGGLTGACPVPRRHSINAGCGGSVARRRVIGPPRSSSAATDQNAVALEAACGTIGGGSGVDRKWIMVKSCKQQDSQGLGRQSSPQCDLPVRCALASLRRLEGSPAIPAGSLIVTGRAVGLMIGQFVELTMLNNKLFGCAGG
jgi:hypothetical protein